LDRLDIILLLSIWKFALYATGVTATVHKDQHTL